MIERRTEGEAVSDNNLWNFSHKAIVSSYGEYRNERISEVSWNGASKDVIAYFSDKDFPPNTNTEIEHLAVFVADNAPPGTRIIMKVKKNLSNKEYMKQLNQRAAAHKKRAEKLQAEKTYAGLASLMGGKDKLDKWVLDLAAKIHSDRNRKVSEKVWEEQAEQLKRLEQVRKEKFDKFKNSKKEQEKCKS